MSVGTTRLFSIHMSIELTEIQEQIKWYERNRKPSKIYTYLCVVIIDHKALLSSVLGASNRLIVTLERIYHRMKVIQIAKTKALYLKGG